MFDINYIERLREHLLLSKKDMADLFSISRQQYINYTSKKSVPRQATLDRILAIANRVVDLTLSGQYDIMPGLSQSERYERLKKLLK